jgi:murein DD-endopeptidase MepM/ murein hydrolase activator NlpD
MLSSKGNLFMARMLVVTWLTAFIMLFSALTAAGDQGTELKLHPLTQTFTSVLEPVPNMNYVEAQRMFEAERVIMRQLQVSRDYERRRVEVEFLREQNRVFNIEFRIWEAAEKERIAREAAEAAAKKAAEEAAAKAAAEAAAKAEQERKDSANNAEVIHSGSYYLPVSNFRITDGFGAYCSCRSGPHTGLDFSAPSGNKVVAVTGGKIIFAGWESGYGNIIKIDHGGGLQTWYAHLSSINNSGTVGAGEQIGRVGSTGNSTGPHLHLEVHVNGSATDPRRWLRNHGLGV